MVRISTSPGLEVYVSGFTISHLIPGLRLKPIWRTMLLDIGDHPPLVYDHFSSPHATGGYTPFSHTSKFLLLVLHPNIQVDIPTVSPIFLLKSTPFLVMPSIFAEFRSELGMTELCSNVPLPAGSSTSMELGASSRSRLAMAAVSIHDKVLSWYCCYGCFRMLLWHILPVSALLRAIPLWALFQNNWGKKTSWNQSSETWPASSFWHPCSISTFSHCHLSTCQGCQGTQITSILPWLQLQNVCKLFHGEKMSFEMPVSLRFHQINLLQDV